MLGALARKFLLRHTTIDQEFPGYKYCREDWLKEKLLRDKDAGTHP